ncbi:MAG TPA: hypothetical protein VEI28_06820, partial [Thermodesulfovibrionales bacterium]|nr:hypothetical protein [Thermodesulfovibrionales bacterium]
FPGETAEEYRGLRTFVEEMRFERLGVFVYSREEGTPAAGMKGSVPRRLREARREEIMSIQSQISYDVNKILIGQKVRALLDEKDGDTIIGRLPSQAPEIDGVVIIEHEHGTTGRVNRVTGRERHKGTSRLTHRKPLSLMPGEFVDVEIREAYDYDLRGELAE